MAERTGSRFVGKAPVRAPSIAAKKRLLSTGVRSETPVSFSSGKGKSKPLKRAKANDKPVERIEKAKKDKKAKGVDEFFADPVMANQPNEAIQNTTEES